MKKLICTVILLSSFFYSIAGDDKTVTLITSGQGKTQDEAKQNALRNAIEQAFGAFISSHTEVVNDNLVKDEIISVSNGNIQKYEIISESALPDNLGYTTTLKTIVSISKLASFCESKGMQIEIKGSLFAFNVIKKELSASNEKKALEDLELIVSKIIPKLFNYKIEAKEPYKDNSINLFCLPLKVVVEANDNWNIIFEYINSILRSLSIPTEEINDLATLGIKFYPVTLISSKSKLTNSCSYYKFKRQKFATGWTRELSKKEFEDEMWNETGWGFIALDMLDFKYYNKNTLYFRNEIQPYLERIQNAFDEEQSKWEIKVAENKSLFSGVKNHYTKCNLNILGIQKWNGSSMTTSGFNIFGSGNPDFVNGLNTKIEGKLIFLHNLKSGTIQGLVYKKVCLSLEEIKKISLLEVSKIQ